MEEVAVVGLHGIVGGVWGQSDDDRPDGSEGEDGDGVEHEVSEDVLVGQGQGLEDVAGELVVKIR